jgi:hypothetical protein
MQEEQQKAEAVGVAGQPETPSGPSLSTPVAITTGDTEMAGVVKPPTAPAPEVIGDPPQPSEYDAEAKIKGLEAMVSELRKSIDATDGQVSIHRSAMMDSILTGLNVLDKYKSFAPVVDPFTDEGKQTLEKWAAANPEILAARLSPSIEIDTTKLKSDMRSPHLVDFKTFARSVKGGGR